MIGAISSKGKTFFAINQGKNNSLTFLLFMLNLILELDSLDPDWRKTTTIMLDKASIHRAKATKAYFLLLRCDMSLIIKLIWRIKRQMNNSRRRSTLRGIILRSVRSVAP